MNQTTLDYKRIVRYLPGAVLLLIFIYFVSKLVSTESVRAWVLELGAYGALGILVYTVASHVFAPIAGTPGIVLSVGLFGLYQTLIATYIAGLISSVLCFYLSRIFGRKVVIKLVGIETMNEIDNYTKVVGKRVLILARIFGFPIFEVISYAAGLTQMPFKTYFVITVIFSAIPSFTFNFLFGLVDFTSTTSMLLFLGVLIITGASFIVLFRRVIKFIP